MYKKPLFITLALLSFVSLQANYTLKESQRNASKIDKMPKNIVDDMKKIPQDPSFYAKQIKPFSKTQQETFEKEFNKKYFKPWSANTLEIPKKDFGWEINFVSKKPIYRSNGSVIPYSVYSKWIENADYSQVNSKKYKAITVKHTNATLDFNRFQIIMYQIITPAI
jgi:hypothetical protein